MRFPNTLQTYSGSTQSGMSAAEKNIHKLSKDLEKSFLTEMFQQAKIGAPPESNQENSHYTQTFSSFMSRAYAEKLSESTDSIGIATQIEKTLMQGLKGSSYGTNT